MNIRGPAFNCQPRKPRIFCPTKITRYIYVFLLDCQSVKYYTAYICHEYKLWMYQSTFCREIDWLASLGYNNYIVSKHFEFFNMQERGRGPGYLVLKHLNTGEATDYTVMERQLIGIL